MSTPDSQVVESLTAKSQMNQVSLKTMTDFRNERCDSVIYNEKHLLFSSPFLAQSSKTLTDKNSEMSIFCYS